MTTALAQWIIGADNDIELGPPPASVLPGSVVGVSLQDTTDGSYPTTATVTGSLYDANGTVVAGASNIALPYVAGTAGASTLYRGVLTAAISATLIEGATYEFRALATDASGNKRPLNLKGVAVRG